ncbi:transcriptional regulator, TetR family [Actinopolyspora mzabensis]|uniref:Transcriptional regulator, TetR family n=1 Tax=Actinopolyspora mzabensis TaxID=995066 RepID=A0A1G8ZUX0_ACTMZ|nr:TetR/AcrR family transcriptional regulator [Actinopolyspora mzabensis]SDK18922.1 transcriptional regulator, TetR family [Actinopolyspora mzabensis]
MSSEQETSNRRTGRPPLTERRKAATRMDIAREAVRLFTSKGVAETSAEELAEAAGVSIRTLWRYCPGPGKESFVRPLLTHGIEDVARALADWAPGEALPDQLRGQAGGEEHADMATMLALVRLTKDEPEIRAVWLQAHRDAEPAFATGIAHRTGRRADELTVKTEAAMVNTALRVAVEHTADHAPAPEKAGTVLRAALREVLPTISREAPAAAAGHALPGAPA